MGLSRQMEKTENFMDEFHFALFKASKRVLVTNIVIHLHCNKIPHYEKYYHYVENCLFTPIYLPRILPIELVTSTEEYKKSHGGSVWQRFQNKS